MATITNTRKARDNSQPQLTNAEPKTPKIKLTLSQTKIENAPIAASSSISSASQRQNQNQ